MMDPFEVRMQFLSLLRRLDATQSSIRKVVSYALKYFSGCGDDLWDCLVEECQKGTLNMRINILYLLDTLCETSLLSKASLGSSTGPANASSSSSSGAFYVDFVQRDLGKIVSYVVPEGREGLINLMSATQILDNWRSKRILDPATVDAVLAKLEIQKATMHSAGTSANGTSATVAGSGDQPMQEGDPDAPASLHRSELFRRIEEDRERHKRLRERRWVQPILPTSSAAGTTALVTQLASLAPDPDISSSVYPPAFSAGASNADTSHALPGSGVAGGGTVGLRALDIEFDNEWETTSDWNEDDEDAIVEENTLCYPNAAVRLDLGQNSNE